MSPGVARIVLGAVSISLLILMSTHHEPRFMSHFELQEFDHAEPAATPDHQEDGLAFYSRGDGPPILLFPYPHGHTVQQMIRGPLADALVNSGMQVLTFDVPGAYLSTRKPTLDMREMLDCALETLRVFGVTEPIDVVGHSMGGFCALAFAIEEAALVDRLILVGACPSMRSAIRHGLPGSRFHILQADYWRIVWWGLRVGSGHASFATHKKLQNLMARASTADSRFFTPLCLNEGDEDKGVPIRMQWSTKLMRSSETYAQRLSEVAAKTLVVVGRHDPQTPIACSEELQAGIEESHLVIFEHSGHSPFIEEEEAFRAEIHQFLAPP